MLLTCSFCSRANPADALFCYHDGRPLGDPSRRATADPSRRRFPMPFVFPGGRSCHTFDELALACLDQWESARELLRDGVLAGFLGGLGRADLAVAARQAARNPDRDQGLDQLLARLPARSLSPAKLLVEPAQVNLGTVRVGQDGRLELHLRNGGMGLLQGSVNCEDCAWLSLGGGGRKKVFQFLHDATVPLQVRGRQLRANAKPQQGRLLIESNGGSVTVPVTVEVPVTPFPEGALAGARSPRQLAEKARDLPKEAAALFGSGAVARWYRDNGWTYPVEGPSASGVAVVQQFFEALGLTVPPKVEVSEQAVTLYGRPGDTLEYAVRVTTPEKRPVYAHARSDQPWLVVEGVDFEGRTATVRLKVPRVPPGPGDGLKANLVVTANGRQRFVLPVSLAVIDPNPRARAGAAVEEVLPVVAPPWPAPAVVLVPVQAARPVEEVLPVVAVSPPPRPARYDEPPPDDFDDRARRRRGLLPVLPVLFLALGLFVTFVRDLAAWLVKGPLADEPDDRLVDKTPRLDLAFHEHDKAVWLAVGGSMKPADDGARPADAREALWKPSMRFGIRSTAGGSSKLLTREGTGDSNNTCVRVDGHEWLFGESPWVTREGALIGQQWPGRWVEMSGKPGKGVYHGRKSVWLYPAQNVQVTQTVGLVPGPQSGLLDTCLVHYKLENLDRAAHTVGLRFLLDTYIGANDGVPFLIPGERQLCLTSKDFNHPRGVPDFIQARERDDLNNPGTIAHLQFRLGGPVEAPGRVTLGAWPNPHLNNHPSAPLLLRSRRAFRQEKTLWDVPVLPIKTLPEADSAVVLYWYDKRLEPGQSREVGFTYGLGQVAGGEGQGRLALTAGGDFTPHGTFTVTAYVNNPVPGQTVTLSLPEGFTLAEGGAAQRVPPLPADATSRASPVTWKVKAGGREGSFAVKVQSSNRLSQTQPIKIRARGIFGG